MPARPTRARRPAAHADRFALEHLEARALLAFSWSADEVYLTELVNRARANPQAEAVLLGVDLTEGLTAQELERLVPQEPLALNEALTVAARLHSLDMAERDFFEHVNPDGLDPTDRAVAQGYSGSAGENIAAGYDTVERAHKEWLISLGHRKNVLSLHDTFTSSFHYDEFGPGFAFTDIGPFYNYYSQEFGVQGANARKFILGVVYDDADHDEFYTVGEGLANVRVDVALASNPLNVLATYTTDAAGNYQLGVVPGSYLITFTNLTTGKLKVEDLTVSSVNVKLDLHADDIINDPPPPPTDGDDHPDAEQWDTATLVVFAAGEGEDTGILESADDSDLFRFVAPESGLIQITLVSIADGLDIKLRVYGENHLALGVGANHGDGTDARFRFNAVGGQTYFILASANDGSGAFRLDLEYEIDGPDDGNGDDGGDGNGGDDDSGSGGDDGGSGGGSDNDDDDNGSGDDDDGDGGGGSGGGSDDDGDDNGSGGGGSDDDDDDDKFAKGSASGDGLLTVISEDDSGRPVVLQQDGAGNWVRVDLLASAGGPEIGSDFVTFTDRATGRNFIAAVSEFGLVLYTNLGSGPWSVRNLTAELDDAEPIVSHLTIFQAIDGQITIAGLTEDAELVLYSRAFGTESDSLGGDWTFKNVSDDDLAPDGLQLPAFVGGIISYVTGWNGLNIAGLDADGDIWTVWWAPGLQRWTVSNLSDITGAPALTGGLTAYLTSWGGINLAGADSSGRTSVTWWVPEFVGTWVTSNLSDLAAGPNLRSSSVTSYVTPWGGLNIAGLDQDGTLVVYWWAPGMENWQVSRLGDLGDDSLQPTGTLAGVASPTGEISLLGVSAGGQLLRYNWSPQDEWRIESVDL